MNEVKAFFSFYLILFFLRKKEIKSFFFVLIQRQAGAVQTDESKKIRNGKKKVSQKPRTTLTFTVV